MSTNQPPFDPLNPTPEEEADMVAGYMDGWKDKPPTRESLAYAWGRGSAARDKGDEPDAQRRDVERRAGERMRNATDQPPPAAPDICEPWQLMRNGVWEPATEDELRAFIARMGLHSDAKGICAAVMCQMLSRVDCLRAALQECADDLERKVWALFPVGRLGIRLPPDQERYNDHMAPVRRARELLR